MLTLAKGRNPRSITARLHGDRPRSFSRTINALAPYSDVQIATLVDTVPSGAEQARCAGLELPSVLNCLPSTSLEPLPRRR